MARRQPMVLETNAGIHALVMCIAKGLGGIGEKRPDARIVSVIPRLTANGGYCRGPARPGSRFDVRSGRRWKDSWKICC